MAAPPEVNLKDLTGDWVMNKTLSDDTDAVLSLQGVGWAMRKAISWSTVTLHIKQYTSPDGKVHIDIDQTATGGIKGTSENRVLDYEERAHSDYMFGDLKGKTRWIAAGSPEWEALDPFLKDGWLEGEGERAGPNGETHVDGFVTNEERGWTAQQIWGFAIIDGKRYYTRRVVVIKGSKTLCIRLVYDRQPKA